MSDEQYFHENFLEVYGSAKYLDRGSKKWVAMMLTEHVKLLREYSDEIKRDPRPELNEWDLEAIHDCLNLAMLSKADTKIKLWRDGQFFYKRGTIESVDLQRRTLELDDPFSLFQINIDEIVDVTIMD
ncbi:YolD-like family protein [Psychrobacillus sp. INOP01]|uniref:YolD-like family protein n=1 Tax=Psychrobacillus sp. INOP01 TaxID=2829187 RepID=UPI001BAD1067|nr:YolD-like family protein [Psychrobacillus sp. INOP01]QUG41231.1 YolD-like family protein [Psychrobacillus sp. INOP01]